jgi:hypothetical protein
MTWGEAVRLTDLLLEDPSSMVAAKASGWEHPITREDAVLRDLFDLQHMAKSDRKPKPYPRPWPSEGRRRRGRTKMTRAEVVAVLNAHGHSLTA